MTDRGELTRKQKKALLDAWMSGVFENVHGMTITSLENRGLAHKSSGKWRLTDEGKVVARRYYGYHKRMAGGGA